MDDRMLAFTVRDLTETDLPWCGWAGSGVVSGLDRARRGEVDYLVVCPPSDRPVATGGVDWAETPGAGTLYQLHVHEILRSNGLGTLLIGAAEGRIRDRGLTRALLGVDARDPRPRPLYERLGYVAYGEEPGGWDQRAPDGSVERYETTIILMRKELRSTGAALDPGVSRRGGRGD